MLGHAVRKLVEGWVYLSREEGVSEEEMRQVVTFSALL